MIEEMEREIQNGAYNGRVMTEEQMEILRKQIAVYAVICDQLVLLHNSLSSSHPFSSGTLLSSSLSLHEHTHICVMCVCCSFDLRQSLYMNSL